MVALFVNGSKVGTLADVGQLMPQFLKDRQTVVFQDADGRTLGQFVPEPSVPWNPAITAAELERRANTPGGMTLAEFWKSMEGK